MQNPEYIDLTIAIPSRGTSTSLLRAIKIACASRAREIIVSINPGEMSLNVLDFAEDSRIKVYFNPLDIGLYGNFRRLIELSTSKYFVFQCIDDEITQNLDVVIEEMEVKKSQFCIPNYVLLEYNPTSLIFFGEEKSGRLPDLNSKSARYKESIYAEPSWIFGVWNLRFIRDIFPGHDFDWLDCILLSKAIRDDAITIEVSNPTIIGTWRWSNKAPHSVNPNGHNPFPAIYAYLSMSSDFFKLNPSLLLHLFRRIFQIMQTSIQLNLNLKVKKRR